jgi:hypothetical protein
MVNNKGKSSKNKQQNKGNKKEDDRDRKWGQNDESIPQIYGVKASCSTQGAWHAKKELS